MMETILYYRIGAWCFVWALGFMPRYEWVVGFYACIIVTLRVDVMW